MNRERIQMAIDALKQVPADRVIPQPDGTKAYFDLKYWHRNAENAHIAKPPAECGTVCCAIGYMTTLPQFQEQGLTLVEHVEHAGITNYLVPSFDGCIELHAVRRFFDISYHAAHNIFLASRYSLDGAMNVDVSPDQVIERLQALLDRDSAEADKLYQELTDAGM